MLLLSVVRPKPLLPRCSKLLHIFPGRRSHFSLNFWASLDPEVTVHQISAELCPFEFLFIYLLFFFFLFPINSTQFTSRTLNYTGVSLCATSYYLPRAYNAPLAELLLKGCRYYVDNCLQNRLPLQSCPFCLELCTMQVEPGMWMCKLIVVF